MYPKLLNLFKKIKIDIFFNFVKSVHMDEEFAEKIIRMSIRINNFTMEETF